MLSGLFWWVGAIATKSKRTKTGKRAHRRTGRPRGRPKRGALKVGEVAAIEIANELCAKLGEDDPVTREILGMLAAIARGDVGWRGRYIGNRLRAVIELGNRRLGKPVQPLDHSGKIGFTLEDLLAGKSDPDAPGD